MIEKIAKTVVERQIESKNIKIEESEIYFYGYILLLEFSLNSILSLFIGSAFHSIELVITFLIIFISLRSVAGGYHAKSFYRCMMLTNSMILLIIISTNFIFNWSILFAEIPVAIILFNYAPCESENKPLNMLEKKKYKKCTIRVYLIQLLILGISVILSTEKVTATIVLTHCMVVISILQVVKNKKKRR